MKWNKLIQYLVLQMNLKKMNINVGCLYKNMKNIIIYGKIRENRNFGRKVK